MASGMCHSTGSAGESDPSILQGNTELGKLSTTRTIRRWEHCSGQYGKRSLFTATQLAACHTFPTRRHLLRHGVWLSLQHGSPSSLCFERSIFILLIDSSTCAHCTNTSIPCTTEIQTWNHFLEFVCTRSSTCSILPLWLLLCTSTPPPSAFFGMESTSSFPPEHPTRDMRIIGILTSTITFTIDILSAIMVRHLSYLIQYLGHSGIE
mmetsp:Transcript_46990/g.142290  ORF Transcript_46990/g.142290 Transcript_46990/m.142290 type:complete len:208 (+) Transcript_46990:460-1083(+)